MRPEPIYLKKANYQEQKHFFYLDAMRQTTSPYLQPLRGRYSTRRRTPRSKCSGPMLPDRKVSLARPRPSSCANRTKDFESLAFPVQLYSHRFESSWPGSTRVQTMERSTVRQQPRQLLSGARLRAKRLQCPELLLRPLLARRRATPRNQRHCQRMQAIGSRHVPQTFGPGPGHTYKKLS